MSGTPHFSHRTLLSWSEEMTWRRWAASFLLPSFSSELNFERNKQQLLSEQTHKRTNTFECISQRFWNCRWVFGKIVFLKISPYSSLWMDWKKILEQKRVSKPVKEENATCFDSFEDRDRIGTEVGNFTFYSSERFLGSGAESLWYEWIHWYQWMDVSGDRK